MRRIFIDDNLFQAFFKHMSANINVLDLVNTASRFGAGFDMQKDDPIWLITPDASMFSRLLQFEYQDFLRKFVANLRILPSCHDVYLSGLEKQSFDLFVMGFERLTVDITVQFAEKRFEIHVPMLISDLIMPIVGRVHEEILMALKHFREFIKAVGNRPDGGFLSAKAPTPESQFIQMWVASKLKVPANPAATVVVVV